MYKQSEMTTDVDKDSEGDKQGNLLESILLGRCNCGEVSGWPFWGNGNYGKT